MTDTENFAQNQHSSPDESGNPPKPGNVAQPTYWPLILAVGITMFAWGWVTTLLFTALGLILIIAAIVNWIGDIRHDRGYEQERD